MRAATYFIIFNKKTSKNESKTNTYSNTMLMAFNKCTKEQTNMSSVSAYKQALH